VKYTPFMRGVMRFEDYNYNNYNQTLLLDKELSQKMQNNGYNFSKIGS
jgi:hypothetical protein